MVGRVQEIHWRSPELPFPLSGVSHQVPGDLKVKTGLQGRQAGCVLCQAPPTFVMCRYCGQMCRQVPIPACVSVQSDPEFAQWLKELTCTFTEAQRLLRRAPKFLNKPRTTILEFSKPPLCHRNSSGL